MWQHQARDLWMAQPLSFPCKRLAREDPDSCLHQCCGKQFLKEDQSGPLPGKPFITSRGLHQQDFSKGRAHRILLRTGWKCRFLGPMAFEYAASGLVQDPRISIFIKSPKAFLRQWSGNQILRNTFPIQGKGTSWEVFPETVHLPLR